MAGCTPGDVGEFDDGHLRIIDRKKEIIINAAGKNMSPAHIEARLKESDQLIGEAVVIGDNRPYNVALVVPDRRWHRSSKEISVGPSLRQCGGLTLDWPVSNRSNGLKS